MTSFRHAVVGLDLGTDGALSAGSRAAIAHVRWLAEGESLACSLVHSQAPDEVWNPLGGFEASPEGDLSALEAALEELQSAGVKADLEVTRERAVLAIVRKVIEGPCDLVLIGKRAEHDPRGPAIGSTAAKLLRKCPCAVWAVRPDTVPPPRHVLAATDLSAVGEKVIQRAAQLAHRAAAPLDIVHALQLSMSAQLGAGESAEEFAQREKTHAETRIREELAAVEGFRAEATLHVGVTSPSHAVLEGCERLEPDLVVMGTVSRGGIPGLLLGNTAERLLTRLAPSLLTLKPADFVCPIQLPD